MAEDGTPHPEAFLAASKYPLIVTVYSATWALGAIAVALRVLCRRLTKHRLWLDDWLIIAAMVLSGASLLTIVCWTRNHGLGRHIWAAPPDALKVGAQAGVLGSLSYTMHIVLVKFSILFLYWRIFSIEDSTRPLIWILFGVVCSWGVAVLLVIIFQCLPIRAIWDRYDPVNPMRAADYSCRVDIRKFYLGTSIFNSITDIFLMLLPLPYLWNLRLQVAQKVAVIGIFVCSGFVAVISIARLFFVADLNLKSPDVTWNTVDEAIWTVVESNIGTVCACLPTLKPLLNLIMYGNIHTNSWSTGLGSGTPVLNSYHEC